MSKGSKSRVRNKKQYDNNFDEIKKKEKSESIRSEIVKKTDYGRVTRYHY